MHERSWVKPPNRPAGHVVRPANLVQRLLATLAALDRLTASHITTQNRSIEAIQRDIEEYADR